MLVLSRHPQQGIQFPGLGVSIEILEVQGNKVKVGVDAPLEVRVLRNELVDSASLPEEAGRFRLPKAMRHELRNALHELSLRMHVYLKRAQREGGGFDGSPIDAEEMLQAIIQRLEHVGGRRTQAEPPQPVRNGELSLNGKVLGKALVVDDDANERELLAGFLRMCDYEVDSVQDGEEAMRFVQQFGSPRFILLDMCMPRCDGRSFLKQLRQESTFDNTHVFVVSGRMPEEMEMSSLSSGYTHWFTKPLDPRRIVTALKKIEENSGLAAAS